MHMNPPQHAAVVNVEDEPNAPCDACGNEYYYQAIEVKKVSGLKLGVAQGFVFLPCPVFICSQCGKKQYIVPASQMAPIVPAKKQEIAQNSKS